MDQLILEIQTADLHRYFPIPGGLTRVGRAYDNDIILSDPTISAHHFEINATEDSVTITNCAEVNPLLIDDQQSATIALEHLALPFKAGRLNLVIRNRHEPVAPTRPLAGKSTLRNPFGHWLWVAFLLLTCLALGSLEFYLDSYQTISTTQFAKHLLSETLIGLAAFVVGLSILEKLLVNRWEVKQVMVAVCLMYILGSLLEPTSDFADYYFSSGIPGTVAMLSWFLLFVPLAITLYLVHISHLAARRSAFIAILISAPLAIPAIMHNDTLSVYFRGFSTEAHYQQDLSSFNLHLKPSLSVESFIREAAELEPGKRSN